MRGRRLPCLSHEIFDYGDKHECVEMHAVHYDSWFGSVILDNDKNNILSLVLL